MKKIKIVLVRKGVDKFSFILPKYLGFIVVVLWEMWSFSKHETVILPVVKVELVTVNHFYINLN